MEKYRYCSFSDMKSWEWKEWMKKCVGMFECWRLVLSRRSVYFAITKLTVHFSFYFQVLTQPTFQRPINVVSTLWINNLDPTLRIKQNPTSDCTTLIQCQCLTLKQCQNNVAQRWYNFVLTLLRRSFDVS